VQLVQLQKIALSKLGAITHTKEMPHCLPKKFGNISQPDMLQTTRHSPPEPSPPLRGYLIPLPIIIIMDNENFYLTCNGETFRLVDFLASLDAESADNGEETDTELVSSILALEVGESIGEDCNMETITRVAPAMLYKTGGTVEEIQVPDGNNCLSILQKAVAGFVERVTTTDGREMWINEDGKLRGLPLNHKASMLWEGSDFGDPICGDVVITIAGLVK
jgi:hypothetical protein